MLRSLIISATGLAIAGFAVAEENAQMTSLPSAWTPTKGAVIDFDVLRKGKTFGQHVLTFDYDADGRLLVTTDVDLQVKFGPITAFRYRLDSQETWEDGRLMSLSGSANNDGRKTKVRASATGDNLDVVSSKFEGQLPADTIPSSHWNINQVYSGQMLSTETGEVLDIEVENLGSDTVLVGKTEVDATHYRLTSDMVVDLWYDDQSRWVKLSFEARGDTIEYVLNELY